MIKHIVRKRPVEVEAVPFNGHLDSALELWLGDDFLSWVPVKGVYQSWQIEIRTLEGPITASPGDWIIRGVKGEHYPCKPDVFAETYDIVREEES